MRLSSRPAGHHEEENDEKALSLEKENVAPNARAWSLSTHPVSAGTCLKLTQPPNPLATSPQHFICSHCSHSPSRSGEPSIFRPAAMCWGFVWESSPLEATAAKGRPLLLRWERNE